MASIGSWAVSSEEYVGAVSIILPVQAREQALQLQWGDADRPDDKPWIEEEGYYQAGTFKDYRSDLAGNCPILVQRRDADRQTEWHLDQDLLFALELKREGDVWVCPAEDYLEVVRLKRAADGDPELIHLFTDSSALISKVSATYARKSREQ